MNRLADADSLYLRQHAGNPVGWWPWGEPALEEARRRDAPILLSIGCAACHWCHVMAHESFENATTAAVMNADFVCVKVDREQRPDLDRIYQQAYAAMHGRAGGWPLTAFLDPQTLLPIYVGTYFPPEPRYGLPSFREVLTAVGEAWRTRRGEIRARADDWREGIREDPPGAPPEDGIEAVLGRALARMRADFDPRNGGRRGAPKFPAPSEEELLLDLLSEDDGGRPSLESMIGRTLDAMARGGLRDQLDGGFFRYCVDDDWGIPHFEKMLYDNAQLVPLYARAAESLGRGDWAEVARACAGWIDRALARSDGALASALDADSPGGEGAYYVWTLEDVAAALPEADARALAERTWNLGTPPNFEGRAWHLRLADDAPLAEDARRAELRARLLVRRKRRDPPARDEKVRTAWNALASAGLFRAARSLDDPALAAQAERILEVLRATAWRGDVLYAQADSPRSSPGFLDDYAALLDTLLAALAWRWRDEDLRWARHLATEMIARFADRERGGLFLSAREHRTPLARPRVFTDEGTPSGNALAAWALLRLGHLCGETEWCAQAQRTVDAGLAALGPYPEAGCALLRAARRLLRPDPLVVLRAEPSEMPRWSAALARLRRSGAVDLYTIPAAAEGLPEALASRSWREGGVAYWCEGFRCRAPVTDPEQLGVGLGDTARARATSVVASMKVRPHFGRDPE
jgi:uncharacterized protein YyaL (SSP411 family)